MRCVMPGVIPVQRDFFSWYRNIDFLVFDTCKYELKELLKEVQEIGSIKMLEGRIKDCKSWLIRLIKMTIVMDTNLLMSIKSYQIN